MKKEFTKEFILSNRGCYSREQVLALSFIDKDAITLKDFLTSELLLKDKFWWLCKKCELTKDENVLIAIQCAKIVLHLFEDKYSDDKRPRKAIEAAEEYLKTHTAAANAANAAARAAYAAANAANAAARAAYAAADAAADAAAYAAADAAYAAAARAAYAAANAANVTARAAHAAADAAAYADAATAADAAYAAADAAYAAADAAYAADKDKLNNALEMILVNYY